MVKKNFNLILLVFAIFMVFGLTSCNEDKVKASDEMDKILSQFDLTNPQWFELYPIIMDAEFEIDRVSVILKKTTTYPELELRHFGLDNGERLEYKWLRPSNEKSPNSDFRQILVIYLKQHGKDEVFKAIEELKKLDFIKHAQPEYIYDIEEN